MLDEVKDIKKCKISTDIEGGTIILSTQEK